MGVEGGQAILILFACYLPGITEESIAREYLLAWQMLVVTLKGNSSVRAVGLWICKSGFAVAVSPVMQTN